MQAVIQQGQVTETDRIAKEHIHTAVDFNGYLYNVTVDLKQLVRILNNDSSDGIKKVEGELRDQVVSDKYRKILERAVGDIGNILGSAVTGTVAIKSGYALVSIAATAETGPIAALVGRVGLLDIGAYSLMTNFDQYQDASRYKTQLDAV